MMEKMGEKSEHGDALRNAIDDFYITGAKKLEKKIKSELTRLGVDPKTNIDHKKVGITGEKDS